MIKEKSRKVERLKQKLRANNPDLSGEKSPLLPVAIKSKNRKEKAPKTTETEPKPKEKNHQTKTLKTQPKNTRKTPLKISLNASGMGVSALSHC